MKMIRKKKEKLKVSKNSIVIFCETLNKRAIQETHSVEYFHFFTYGISTANYKRDDIDMAMFGETFCKCYEQANLYMRACQ